MEGKMSGLSICWDLRSWKFLVVLLLVVCFPIFDYTLKRTHGFWCCTEINNVYFPCFNKIRSRSCGKQWSASRAVFITWSLYLQHISASQNFLNVYRVISNVSNHISPPHPAISARHLTEHFCNVFLRWCEISFSLIMMYPLQESFKLEMRIPHAIFQLVFP